MKFSTAFNSTKQFYSLCIFCVVLDVLGELDANPYECTDSEVEETCTLTLELEDFDYKGLSKIKVEITIHTLRLVCIFSLLFSIHFLEC